MMMCNADDVNHPEISTDSAPTYYILKTLFYLMMPQKRALNVAVTLHFFRFALITLT